MSDGVEIIDNNKTTDYKAGSSMRNVVFTLYDVSEESKKKLLSLNVKLMVFQLEECPTTKKQHFQGYMEFNNPMPFNQIKRQFPSIHLIKRAPKASALHNYTYCTKDESRISGPFIKGDWAPILQKKKVNNQGKRNDLKIDLLIKDISEGKPYKELIMTYSAIFLKSKQAFDVYYEQYKPQKVLKIEINLYNWQKEVIEILNHTRVHRRIIWIWSDESGTGKSLFKQYCENIYSVLEVNTDNFTNLIHVYDNHRIIWLNLGREDILTSNHIRLLERLSDGGYVQSTKFNGSRKFIDSHIVVTSNHSPPHDRIPKRIMEFCVDFEKNKSDDLQFNLSL